MEIKSGIYKITNIENNHAYIGQSVNIYERWKKHRSIGNNYSKENSKIPLYAAMYKYGMEKFNFEILEECSSNKEELNKKEEYYIKLYNTYYNGYNQTKGGDDQEHLNKLTLEQVNEIKELLKNSSMSEENIGKKYGISLISVSNISIGKYWHDDNINYPIRKIESKKFYCKECGKELSNYQESKIKTYLCFDCYKKLRNSHIPTREILKEKIRNQSFDSIAKEYGFKSGNTVKKWCKKLNLPYLKSEINKYTDEEWELI